MKNVKICVAPLSNRVVLARFGKDKSVALETRDAMNEFWQSLVQFTFDGRMPDKGEAMEVSFGGGDEQFTMRLERKGDGASDFVQWAGGECPVAPNKEVTVRLRNGEELTDITGFGPLSLDWRHRGEERDIVAYRLEAA